jgi:hypothetical protein
MLDRAAHELADTEKMVEAAERLYGPYRWGRYDVLVLPPAFPYGGMENATLTFLTPTFITGDRANVSLVAHELAHSWSGNLVTNATWPDVWLNEGFTSYVENRIMEAIYGRERAVMEADLAWDSLQADIKELGGPTAPATRLYGEPGGQIDYFKGETFLRTLETTLGRERWDAYLRGYFDRYAFQPQTTAGFLADFRREVVKGDAALEAKLNLDAWAYQPGLPANAVHLPSARLEAVDRSVRAFVDGAAAATLPAKAWTTQEWQRFLNNLPRRLTAAQLADLDRPLGLDERLCPVCMAGAGDRQPLRARPAVAAPVPRHRRTGPLREPALHRADAAGRLGPGAGAPILRRGAGDLPPEPRRRHCATPCRASGLKSPQGSASTVNSRTLRLCTKLGMTGSTQSRPDFGHTGSLPRRIGVRSGQSRPVGPGRPV